MFRSFRAVFIAVVLGAALIAGALLIHQRRPSTERNAPSPELVRATGRCAECHRRETSAILAEFERSKHGAKGVNCLDCHQPAPGQASMEHRGFTIAKQLTSKNCAQCHAAEYDQFARSRHAGPAWAAVTGARDFSPEQKELGERWHKGWIERPPNALVALEGDPAIVRGCNACHSIGKPQPDGSFGTCTNCHSRHAASVALARQPFTCGQCHMGPDHSQIEIYGESKHGAMFYAQQSTFDLSAPPKKLTTAAMPVPTCATCHMSGLEGMNVTHDTTERLSWYLFAPVSTKRPGYAHGQERMKELCTKCHARPRIDGFFSEAEAVVLATNAKVGVATGLVEQLRKDGFLGTKPFSSKIDFTVFDLWHYYGRTAKHGAFMGGADFVQWHGNYEILRLGIELAAEAKEIREQGHAQGGPAPAGSAAPAAPAPSGSAAPAAPAPSGSAAP